MLALILIGLATVAIIPFIQQIQILSERFPQYLDGIVKIPGMEAYAQKFNEGLFTQLSQAGGNIIGATIGAFSGALSAILMLVFTIYILLDFDNLRKMFVEIFPKYQQEDALKTLLTIERKLGGWLRGQLALMIIIGVTTYLGLILLGINFALALAVIAGLLEIVPIVGPIISVIPAAIVGFAISPVLGFAIIGLYIIIQQLENQLIVPKVMQKAIGFNPLVTIVALMVGGKLLGLVGAILAIPFTIIIAEVIKYALTWEKRSVSTS
jgi:predicted PurR-regulated permease PerM